MSEFRARIGDIGPANGSRGRARLHYVAITYMRKYPFERQPGETICNPNLDIPPADYVNDVEEATCAKCLVRADRYGIQIVTGTPHTDRTPPPATTGDR